MVTLKHPLSGEMKHIKIGWSWTLLFFSAWFGIPLFLRKLHGWGAAILAMWLVLFIVGWGTFFVLLPVVWIVFLVLEIILAIKGNEMTAKKHLRLGWIFAYPDSLDTKRAKEKWNITN